MSNVVLKTTNQTVADSDHDLLSKILYRLNLSAGVNPTSPAANVAITNTPLPVDAAIVNTPNVAITNTPNVNVSNWPAGPFGVDATIVNTPNVGVTNFPAVQQVAGTVSVTGLTFQDGHLSALQVPFEFEISHMGAYLENGVAKAAFVYRGFGRRSGFNSTTVQQDVAEWLGTSLDRFPEMTGLENLELVSSSANDDASPAGTGIQRVRIAYLNTSYVLAFVEYNLNGTVAVAVAEKMLFVYCMEALTGGILEGAGGNIDLRTTGTGLIHERIAANSNRSRTARFMVPDNYKAYLCSWTAFAIGTTMDCRVRTTTQSFSQVLGTRYIVKSNMYLGASQNANQLIIYKQLPARAKLKVCVIPGAAGAGNRVDCEFAMLLIQD
jgi:hypothetical protein